MRSTPASECLCAAGIEHALGFPLAPLERVGLGYIGRRAHADDALARPRQISTGGSDVTAKIRLDLNRQLVEVRSAGNVQLVVRHKPHVLAAFSMAVQSL